MSYRTRIYALCIITALSVASPALAGLIGHTESADGYILPKENVIHDNFYVSGDRVVTYGTVEGDLITATPNAVLSGFVTDDVLVFSPTVVLDGSVDGDARALGWTVAVSGYVGGDLATVAGTLTVAPDALIGADTLVVATDAILNGTYAGDVKVVAQRVKINGTIAGSVKVIAQEVTIGSGANIAGEVVWGGKVAPLVEEGAVIVGGMSQSDMATFLDQTGVSGKRSLIDPFFIFSLFSALLCALVFTIGWKNSAIRYAERVEQPAVFIRTGLWGLLSFIAMPVVIVLLAASLVGALLSLATLALYVVVLVFAHATAGFLFGEMLYRLITRGSERETPWKTALVGVFVLGLVGRIPFIGSIVYAVFFLVALGTTLGVIWSFLRELRLPMSGNQVASDSSLPRNS
jgi:cytoskeletal protein CcmA (bactofilin family)